MGVLSQKVVIITGAGSGLGRETALLFAREGAQMAICDRNSTNIQEVEQLLKAEQGSVLAFTADVSREEDVMQLVETTHASFGRIDILINNAAVYENYYISNMTLESWNYHLSNNATSAFLMTKACIPIMRKQKTGKIINLTSILAKSSAAGFGAYSASKAALEMITYAVDGEESRNNIAITAFDPGVMKTGMQATGVDPVAIAPSLLRLATADNRYAGKVVHVDQLEKANR